MQMVRLLEGLLVVGGALAGLCFLLLLCAVLKALKGLLGQEESEAAGLAEEQPGRWCLTQHAFLCLGLPWPVPLS
jgi:hypothetical protein